MKEARKIKADPVSKLTKIVTDGFAKVNKRFDFVDKRFDLVDSRIDRYATATAEDIAELRIEMNERFDAVNDRLETNENSLDTVENNLDTVKKLVVKLDSVVHNGFQEINSRLDHSDTRVSGVEGIILNRDHPSKVR